MILQQYYLGCLSHASYLIGDERTHTAVIVDPQRDVDGYIDDARRLGLEIRKVILTHFHADFVAGHLELRERTGAEISLGARGRTDFAAAALADGDSIEIGDVRLAILETPGHTPESISILVYDLARSASAPHAVLTGDTLFIGDVGRPDLLVSVGLTANELAGMLYDSLRNKLLPLPDETLVYPAHGAGSACGKNMSKETCSTLGVQKRVNWALQPMPRQEFVRQVTADQPEMPAYFAFDAAQNQRERATLDEVLRRRLAPLSLDEVAKLRASGAIVLDVREPDDFAAGHLAGSTNIGLSGKYATWAGTLLDRKHPIVIVAPPGKEREAALRLCRIGFDQIAGYLDRGPAAFTARADLAHATERIAPSDVAAELALAEPPFVLDVRTPAEWKSSHFGDLNVPLSRLGQDLALLPRNRRIVVHCQSGYRSSIAASLLRQHGLTNVADMVGGIAAWERARLATTT
jgi:glyoxylase-like metal-dependent hydrolase (beta-lactamase superfamily II)/rhodanese-related sulfurtransferase